MTKTAILFAALAFVLTALFISGCTTPKTGHNTTNASIPHQNISYGKCGDGTCDSIEQQNHLCPKDCGNANGGQQPGNQSLPGAGKCGDGICDSVEKTTGFCPKDCETANVSLPFVQPTTAGISVDYSAESGQFSPFIFGTTSAPYFDQHGFDLSKDAGFRVIEFMYSIGTANVPADVNDPSSYDFSLLDQQVEAIFASGAEPLILFAPERKPADPDAYATFAANVAKHLTQGWGNGHYWNVRLFRFGNEPEGPGFWNGTHQEFFQTYGPWAKALKGVNQSFILDSPGFQNVHQIQVNGPGSLSITNKTNPFLVEFLDYCKQNSVPLDVLSFHVYSTSPYEFYGDAKLAASILQNYSGISPLYGTPKLGNDEWNFIIGDLWSGTYKKEFDTSWAAADNINSLINMVEQGLSFSIKYGGTFNGQQNCHDFLLTGCDGSGRPAFYAFKAFNTLSGSTRLETQGTDHMNLAAIAGKNDAGISVVISDYDFAAYLENYSNAGEAHRAYEPYAAQFGNPKTYDGFNVTLRNLPWGASDTLVYERYLVDDSHNLSLVENRTVSGASSLSFSGDMAAPSVQLIKIRKE